MKSLYRFIYVASFFLLVPVSCRGKKVLDNWICCSPHPPYNNSFIQKFTEVDHISAANYSGIKVIEDNKRLVFRYYEKECEGFFIDVIASADSNEREYSANDSRGKYQSIIYEIGDTSFYHAGDRKYRFLCDPSLSTSVAGVMSSVSVTCDKNYIEGLPNGSSMNDIVTVFYDDYCKIVENGYKTYNGPGSYAVKIMKDGKEEDYMEDNFPSAFIGEKLSEVNWEEKKFIGNRWLFVFTERPDFSGEYCFTVSLTMEDGRVLEATTKPVFLCGSKD